MKKTTIVKKASSPSPATTRAATTAETGGYLTITPTSQDADIKANVELADQKAKLWSATAALHYVDIKLPANFELGKSVETYVYGSTSDAYNWWVITISDLTGKSVRALIPKEDYLGTSYPTLTRQYWKMNYVEALQLADSAGGSEFRSSHPDASVRLNLAVKEPKNYLWWTVEYTSATSEPYRLLVNPVTKEVVSETGQALKNGSSSIPTNSPTPLTNQATPDNSILEE